MRVSFLSSRFRPFVHAPFRKFFFIHSLSLIGRWSHELARSWLVLELTGSSKSLGLLLLISSIPTFIFTLQGGVLVDRVNTKKLMMVTQAVMAVLTLILAFLVELTEVQLIYFMVFAFAEGLVLAFDSPAFLTFVTQLVPKEDLQQAMSINSTTFHLGRMVGPVVAGGIMAFWGAGAVFFFDAATFILLLFVIQSLKLRPREMSDQTQSSPIENLKDGLRYVFNNKALRYRIIQLNLGIVTILPLIIVVFRTHMKEYFQLDAQAFGAFVMFPAFGSMLGAMGFALWKPKEPLKLLFLGLPITILAVFIFPLTKTAFSASLVAFGVGFGLYLAFASLTVSLQLLVEESYRGRLSSLVSLSFHSFGMFMAWPVGALYDSWGPVRGIWLLGSIFLFSSCIWALMNLSVLNLVYKKTK